MQGSLLIAILSVRSSYARELELPLENEALPPDTLQWWIAPSGCWRIRTYAIDHDIHTYEVDGPPDEILVLARAGNQKRYGDVLAAEHLVQFADCGDDAEVRAKFRAIGLEPRLEIAHGRFAFWKPDDDRYSTKSRPVEP